MSSDQITQLQKTLLEAMEAASAKTNDNIEQIHNTLRTEMTSIRTELTEHGSRLDKVECELSNTKSSEKFDELSLQIELLKQDRLRNNIRITGLPQIAFDNPDEAILRIAEVLNIDIIPSDYSVYADRHKSSIIVSFHNYIQKRQTMDALRNKQSLFVEEVYDAIKSNSRIYCNDQLTPYFAKIFQCAWRAKKDGSIYSASSLGGRIRVKKLENSTPHTIQTEAELAHLIADQMETETQHNEESQCSHEIDSSHKKVISPQSLDSSGARQIRGKSFSYHRQRSNQTQSNNFQQSSDRPQQKSYSTTNSNHQRNFDQQREKFPKRNNRHVTSLEHHSHQPFTKRNRFTNNHNSPPNRNSNEFRDYRRDYQNRLRSFTK